MLETIKEVTKMTQALTDLLEKLDSDTAKHIDRLEEYKQMLEGLEADDSESYELTLDYIDKLEDLRGEINK